ncbi:hypothetical protein DDZ13_14220 [Coraliomargarita sinensis]|uniref:DUF2059 domain-containing protein n=1 Tax=Coraliomargarita sinensis TaxID=2174842 RepID=A0A317ZGJ7_9BACT|nr:DUF2059 domain-containing protein [Coraliomargarita sinensis]PXA03068.1 hypothetical protein DDZ13_14220 [Coraliomargarita sinensis]
MKKALTIAFTILWLYGIAWSEQSGNHEEIKEVIELLSFEQGYELAYLVKYYEVKNNYLKSDLGLQLKGNKEYLKLVDELMAYFKEKASWEAYEEIYIEYFRQEYTPEEITILRDFLKTSAGQKFYIQMNEIEEKIRPIATENMKHARSEMQRIFDGWVAKNQSILERLEPVDADNPGNPPLNSKN